MFTAPSCAPLNVNITNTSSTALQVMWNPPSAAETHGVIREYNIRYRQVNCSLNGTNLTTWASMKVNGSSTSTNLTNLTQWSCYEVQISAVTIKKGVWSNAKQHRTSEDGEASIVCKGSLLVITVY